MTEYYEPNAYTKQNSWWRASNGPLIVVAILAPVVFVLQWVFIGLIFAIMCVQVRFALAKAWILNNIKRLFMR